MEVKESKLEVLYDHYKESNSLQREHIKQRDRLFLYVLLVIAGLFLLITLPKEVYRAVGDITSSRIGSDILTTPYFLDSILWFLLLCFVLRYFQTCITIERQYVYIHRIEDKISDILEEESFCREGKGYLKTFQLFSGGVWIFYTIIFPILLITVTGLKIVLEIMELCSTETFRFSTVLNIFFFLVIFALTIFYLISYHGKK